MSDPVYLVGLAEFVRDVRKVDKQFPRDIARAMRKAAKRSEGVARRRYTTRYQSGTSGRAARSVKGIAAFANTREAGLKFGGGVRPWLVGQEFGSNRYQQFKPWTGKGPNGRGSYGRFVWPSIREVMEDASAELQDDLMAVYRGAVSQ